MNLGFLAAALLSAGTWGLHTFVGGPAVAGPLVASDLPAVAKWTNYYCWHLVTLTLAGLAAAFAYAAWVPSGLDVAIFATLLSLGFMLWSVALVAWRYRYPWRLPQWTLFAAISSAALCGVLL